MLVKKKGGKNIKAGRNNKRKTAYNTEMKDKTGRKVYICSKRGFYQPNLTKKLVFFGVKGGSRHQTTVISTEFGK